MKKSPLVLAALLLFAAAPIHAREVAGVNVPETVVVDGRPLRLNGAGIRKKLFVKVYVGALYLETPATSLREIIGPDRTWSVHMVFLRSVDKAKIVGAFREGFEKNSREKVAALQPGLDRIGSVIRNLNYGDELIVTYVAGKGTDVSVRGGGVAHVDGKDFGDALLRNWLGPEPADADLKRAMLGGR